MRHNLITAKLIQLYLINAKLMRLYFINAKLMRPSHRKAWCRQIVARESMFSTGELKPPKNIIAPAICQTLDDGDAACYEQSTSCDLLL